MSAVKVIRDFFGYQSKEPLQFRPSKLYRYEPLPDITTWELAVIVQLLVMTVDYKQVECLEELPEEVRRHFKEI